MLIIVLEISAGPATLHSRTLYVVKSLRDGYSDWAPAVNGTVRQDGDTQALEDESHDIYHISVGLSQPHYAIRCWLDSRCQI